MPRKNRRKKKQRENRVDIRKKVNAAVAEAYPGCVAEFCGGVEQSRMASRGRTLGFRIKNLQTRKYHSNIIWVNPEFRGTWPTAWLIDAVDKSNG